VASAAYDFLAGVACANDVSARDLQKSDGQWGRAKGFDTFCPLGPTITSGFEWADLEIIGRVNGEVRQHGHVRDLIFSIPALVEFITGVMTLEPGDVILTGTPEGVGPLSPGDVVEVEIPGVSVLRNPVAGEPA
jgi:2-keto-4-pentenoate hydratase/2-oxohepta-3-ene-1,7-dioic acid hydratase in catechol pathway